jgi:hypothetical protein
MAGTSTGRSSPTPLLSQKVNVSGEWPRVQRQQRRYKSCRIINIRDCPSELEDFYPKTLYGKAHSGKAGRKMAVAGPRNSQDLSFGHRYLA